MNCQQVEKLLGEYLDGRLEATPAAALRRHCQACPACQAQLAGLQAVQEKLRACPPVALPAGFIERTQAAVRQKVAPTPKASPWRTVRWLAPAAALLVISLMAWWPYTEQKATQPSRVDLSSKAYEKAVEPDFAKPAPTPETAATRQSADSLPSEPETLAQKKNIPPELAEGNYQELPLPEKAAKSAPSVELAAPAAPSRPAADGLLSQDEVNRSSAPRVNKLSVPVGAATKSLKSADNPLANFTVLTETDRKGRQAVLLQALPAAGAQVNVYPQTMVNADRTTQGELLTTDQREKIPVLAGQPPQVWQIDLQTAAPTGLGGVGVEESRPASGQLYNLIVPARLAEAEMISLNIKNVAAQTALQEISEKGGVIILLPASVDTPVTLDLQKAPVDSVLRKVAGQLGLRYEQQGVVRNLY